MVHTVRETAKCIIWEVGFFSVGTTLVAARSNHFSVIRKSHRLKP